MFENVLKLLLLLPVGGAGQTETAGMKLMVLFFFFFQLDDVVRA